MKGGKIMPSLKTLLEELRRFGVEPDDIRVSAQIYDDTVDEAEENREEDDEDDERGNNS
jgi:hypothetical protein